MSDLVIFRAQHNNEVVAAVKDIGFGNEGTAERADKIQTYCAAYEKAFQRKCGEVISMQAVSLRLEDEKSLEVVKRINHNSRLIDRSLPPLSLSEAIC
jgi:hypothetical protein